MFQTLQSAECLVLHALTPRLRALGVDESCHMTQKEGRRLLRQNSIEVELGTWLSVLACGLS